MARFFGTKNIVDIKNVIAVLVVVTIILDTFAWLGEYSTRVSGGLVVELGIAQLIRRGQMRRQCLERLIMVVSAIFKLITVCHSH